MRSDGEGYEHVPLAIDDAESSLEQSVRDALTEVWQLFYFHNEQHQRQVESQKLGGVHAVRANTGGDLFATSGAMPTDVAVYDLPSFMPIFVGVVS